MERLSGREERILQSIVDSFIQTAEPVGSRTIAQKYKLGLSPATIRNTVMDLEEWGFVWQPYTSAGRIPTDKGYRYYVDSLMRVERLSPVEKDTIREKVEVGLGEAGQVLEQATRVLADASRQLGVVVPPRFYQGIFKRLDLVRLSEDRVLLVLTIRAGLVRTMVAEIDPNVLDQALDETAQVINERLSGLSLGEIKSSLDERLDNLGLGDPRVVQVFKDSVDHLFDFREFEQLHLGGTKNILSQPEFTDRQKLRSLMEVLEERQGMLQVLNQVGQGEGVTVTIGSENPYRKMRFCSLVASTYWVGNVTGTLGVIGPTRMRYGRLVSLVDYMAQLLTSILG